MIQMSGYKILIVEDEVLIADNIKRYLERKGHQIVGVAISYEEATQLFLNENPDIVLLDIKLSGIRNGIDVARFIHQQADLTPFIYLTSQIDSRNLNEAKTTLPAAYLAKPIQKDSLFATIEIVMHKFSQAREQPTTIPLFDGQKNHMVDVYDILYFQSEHVYLKIHFKGGRQILQRSTLKDFLVQLPKQQFVQTHRSYAVNISTVQTWDNDHVYIGQKKIPISRSRKKEILNQLNTRAPSGG